MKLKSLLALSAVALFAACESTAQGTKDAETAEKTLIVYYSWSENTKTIATHLAARLSADIYEIKTEKAYPKDGWETSEISQKERRENRLPALKGTLPDLSRYGTVFIGAPVWNAYVPTPAEKFLALADLSGKTVVPFSTSQGSGQSGYLSDFKSRAKNPARLGEYKDFRFPNNYRPDAYTAAQIDKMLDEWNEVKVRIRK
jgi:flavodoxin